MENGQQSNTVEDIYSAPEAEIRVVKDAGESYYFTPSTTKLVVLTIVTFSLYWVYWFYKNWARVRDNAGLDIWPVPRAIFSIIFVYPLYQLMREHAEEESLDALPQAGLLATVFIVLHVLSNVMDRLNPESLWAFVSFLAIFPMISFNRLARRVNMKLDPDVVMNDKFTVLNIVGIVFGVIFLILAIIVLSMPIE